MLESFVPQPTDAELTLLRVLWQNGPCTVKQLHSSPSCKHWGYTTVLKFLQIMTEKGLVARQPEGRAHVYRALYAEKETEEQLVRGFMARVFEGSPQRLVLGALSASKASSQELAEIRALLDTLEENG